MIYHLVCFPSSVVPCFWFWCMLWKWKLQLQEQIFAIYILLRTELELAFSIGGKASNELGNALTGDATERFGTREAVKFRFLGEWVLNNLCSLFFPIILSNNCTLCLIFYGIIYLSLLLHPYVIVWQDWNVLSGKMEVGIVMLRFSIEIILCSNFYLISIYSFCGIQIVMWIALQFIYAETVGLDTENAGMQKEGILGMQTMIRGHFTCLLIF